MTPPKAEGQNEHLAAKHGPDSQPPFFACSTGPPAGSINGGVSELGQPQVALAVSEGAEGTKVALLRVARYETVAVLGAGFLAAVCMLVYALDRVLTTPSRISSVLDMEVGYQGLVNDNLRFDAVRALLFLPPLAIVGIGLGAGAFLVAVDSRKRLTPWAFVDRVLLQSASASLLVTGVVLGSVGLAVPVATPHWLVRGAIIVLGTTVIAAGLTTALRAPGRDPRLLLGGLAALVALSATAGVTDTTGISAGQVPVARRAWSGTGFWTAAPAGKPGAVMSYQTVAGPVRTAWPAGLRQHRAPTVASIGRTCARHPG